MLDNVPLYHSFDGINGETPMRNQNLISSYISPDLSGKSVLDIGTFDGYYSFLCEERGASQVVAIDNEDHFQTDSSIGKPRCAGFHTVKETLYPNSKVVYKKLDVYDVEALGTKFDLVLFLGVYYHLKYPLLALEKCFKVTKGAILVEGLVADSIEPVMYFVSGAWQNNKYTDPFTWWVPSVNCLADLMCTAGFSNVNVLFRYNDRAILAGGV